MQIDLSGKRVLVTGGHTGLGAAMAKAFGAAGAKVAVNYVVEPVDAKAIVSDLKKDGGEAMAIEADISDPTAVATMFTTLDMAVVLASDAASYVTATTLFVDGDMTDYPGFMHGG